jgi:Flp pilus assembly protein TadB
MEEESQQHERTSAPGPQKRPSEVDRDAHRGFVREMNKAFASVYGYGGAAVIALVAAGVALAANFGVLGSPLVWIGAVTLFLVALFVLRIFVRRRAQRMLERIRQYCSVNDLSSDEFRQRFGGEGLYPYFESIFEVVERRQKLQNQLRDSK